MYIPYELKKKCVEARETMKAEEVYKKVFLPQHKGMTCESFCRALRRWRGEAMADKKTLVSGTYSGFAPHSATVQVDGNGNITQAWIKQHVDDNKFEQILEAIKEEISPVDISVPPCSEKYMLEIPLFDMHFGIAGLEDYVGALSDIVGIIESKKWEEINVVVGQDLIHTNDLRGHTAKGTLIEEIDFARAWNDAWRFWTVVIDKALANSQSVCVRYSKGNHDECVSWCLVQALKTRYPQCLVDDSFEARRCLVWRGCFIGYGHIEYTNNLQKIVQNFVMDFPVEFANAKVREIHTGHLHTESGDAGAMVRRLASSVPTDKWSRDNGYVGSHKRFEVFEFEPNRLRAIHYV